MIIKAVLKNSIFLFFIFALIACASEVDPEPEPVPDLSLTAPQCIDGNPDYDPEIILEENTTNLTLYNLEIFENAQIEVDENTTHTIPRTLIINEREVLYYSKTKVIPGNKTVFRYQYIEIGEERWADDEVEEIILFEVEAGQEEFFLSGEEDLLKANAYYELYCYCPFTTMGTNAMNNACLKGKKTADDTWQVDISILHSDPDIDRNPYKKMIQGEFKIKNLEEAIQ
ncbi:hypothetical protein FK178_01215 [Antarcticibacterium arcticum]|uniref:Lipoprotein n=1 Tax=Antarcticibacterium arcticum TaxID=2585771 RepID=A0A5B8YEM5_9FLAO|nr:hypothetical protein [Antarcticibacterium arcticum]QED36422.1 hypothetical protein FK178_01215 [Antarcticibacterium arcticum]